MATTRDLILAIERLDRSGALAALPDGPARECHELLISLWNFTHHTHARLRKLIEENGCDPEAADKELAAKAYAVPPTYDEKPSRDKSKTKGRA